MVPKTEVTCSNVDDITGTLGAGLWDTNENFHGIELYEGSGTTPCLTGKTVTSMTTKLWRVTSSSSDLFYFVVIPAGSGTTPSATSLGVAQSTLTTSTSGEILELSFTSPHTMVDGDRIGVWYEGAEGIRMSKSDSVTVANGYLGVAYQGGWNTSSIYQGYVIAVGT